ncbi:hypothetical protein BC332_25400 [Capsicum chinense]|nr:hypothetical protein BC332_25400 [Capsicum chinense]
MMFYHQILMLPWRGEGLNARLLEEKSVMIEVKRKEEDGLFSKKGIEMSIREVIVSEEGRELKARARKGSAVFGEWKLHRSYIRNFYRVFEK